MAPETSGAAVKVERSCERAWTSICEPMFLTRGQELLLPGGGHAPDESPGIRPPPRSSEVSWNLLRVSRRPNLTGTRRFPWRRDKPVLLRLGSSVFWTSTDVRWTDCTYGVIVLVSVKNKSRTSASPSAWQRGHASGNCSL